MKKQKRNKVVIVIPCKLCGYGPKEITGDYQKPQGITCRNCGAHARTSVEWNFGIYDYIPKNKEQ